VINQQRAEMRYSQPYDVRRVRPDLQRFGKVLLAVIESGLEPIL
jgi:hypothetical protein